MDNRFLAAGEGFEPSQTESESGVLPLHKPAITRKRINYYIYFSEKVKSFFHFYGKYFLIRSHGGFSGCNYARTSV